VGVTDLTPPIAVDRPLLPTAGKDRSASFAIDQKDLPIHRKDLSLSIEVYRDPHGYLIKSIMVPPKAHDAPARGRPRVDCNPKPIAPFSRDLVQSLSTVIDRIAGDRVDAEYPKVPRRVPDSRSVPFGSLC
jgi:hypothetical protein